MITHLKSSTRYGQRAFSLIEIVVVIAIISALMGLGIGLLKDTGPQARKSGTDLVTSLLEQARTNAITTRDYVVLAIAEPGDLPATDNYCRLALFRVEEWPSQTGSGITLDASLMNRWQTLQTGVVLLGGNVKDLNNPMDQDRVTIRYGSGSKAQQIQVRIIAFNSRGGLHFPSGSSPIALRLAEGGYRGGKASANKNGPDKTVAENIMKIGRITARPYRIDG